ncbi:MAG: cytochrome c biogenesis protein CcsA [Methyloligellaceae bacterium]
MIFSLAATLTLIAAAVAALRGPVGTTGTSWAVLLAAAAGPVARALAQGWLGWETGFANALWVTIAVCMVVFLLLAAVTRQSVRLAPFLLPYLVLLAISATVWSQAAAPSLLAQSPSVWIVIHIATSVVTYALLTLAAIASAAVLVQEHMLRRKKRHHFLENLPSVADSERLELRLLLAAELVLGLGIISGMAIELLATGSAIIFDHKTIFSLSAFVLIGLLLAAHYGIGLRGRRAARLALAGYLLLTLAYPGVKFVTDVLLA